MALHLGATEDEVFLWGHVYVCHGVLVSKEGVQQLRGAQVVDVDIAITAAQHTVEAVPAYMQGLHHTLVTLQLMDTAASGEGPDSDGLILTA